MISAYPFLIGLALLKLTGLVSAFCYDAWRFGVSLNVTLPLGLTPAKFCSGFTFFPASILPLSIKCRYRQGIPPPHPNTLCLIETVAETALVTITETVFR